MNEELCALFQMQTDDEKQAEKEKEMITLPYSFPDGRLHDCSAS